MRTFHFKVGSQTYRNAFLPQFLQRPRVIKALRYAALSVFGLPVAIAYREPLSRAWMRAFRMLRVDQAYQGLLLFLRVFNQTAFYALWIHHPWGEAKIRFRSLANRLPHQKTISIAYVILADAEASVRDRETTRRSIEAQHSCVSPPRIRVIDPSTPILSFAGNDVFPGSEEFVCFLQPGDRLTHDAIQRVAACVEGQPYFSLIYGDHDYLLRDRYRCFPEFKPDWNYELALAQFYLQTPIFVRTAVLRALLQHRTSECMNLSELLFEIYERCGSESIAHIPTILCNRPYGNRERRREELAQHRQAVADHLRRTGQAARIETNPEAHHGLSLHFATGEDPPLVSIFIPTRNRVDLLRTCIDSIRNKTNYPRYEILVIDNGSDEPDTLRYLEEIAGTRIRVIHDSRPFNFSALNNRAVSQARGEVLAFLNNDVEVITPGWLDEMVGIVVRPGVGAVGARLWYPDDRLQHAGVILVGGVAGHAHKFLPRGLTGYCDRAVLLQEFSAVTAACMVIRKAVFLEVDGFDPLFAVAFNDVDLCLRLWTRGYRNVWTPAAELYHHESVSRGDDTAPDKIERFHRECAQMRERWGDLLRNDPAYNPNLAWDSCDFSLNWERPKF